MATSEKGDSSTMLHVNMMTDTVIKNLPPNGLRTVIRSLLAANPSITKSFEHETITYLRTAATTIQSTDMEAASSIADTERVQGTVRCMIGCGLCILSLPILCNLASQTVKLDPPANIAHAELLASIDGDIVQAMTAIQKLLFNQTGSRELSDTERAAVQLLARTLVEIQEARAHAGQDYPYNRGLLATASVLGIAHPSLKNSLSSSSPATALGHSTPALVKETFQLNGQTVPRIFTGLWQLSSPAWGSAAFDKIVGQFSSYVQRGFNAFDMADHYGDAEILYGHFLVDYSFRDAVYTTTKYCVFHPMAVSQASISENISERCRRLQLRKIDLLQFHWQFYDDPQYIEALQLISQDERVGTVGICNFDTKHMEHILDHGIPIYSNQVQFSLIDSRPTMAMGDVCLKHNVKLLTYGTLCGGFLAGKWLNKPEPDMYDKSITPSQRKYYEQIRNWGDWTLFQELLQTLHSVASKHHVSISNVAVRWVLDFPYVGAVIIGARMGISEHIVENLASLGWSLDAEDQSAIGAILKRSRRVSMFEKMGDCGAEYR